MIYNTSLKKIMWITMISRQPLIDIQDQIINNTDTPLPFQAHLIEVSYKDLDFDPTIIKGIFAVLPLYYEELVIGSIILRTKQYVNHVIVVEYGSSDRTAEVAKLAGAEVYRNPLGHGKE
jgi:hypothetical protein